VLKDVHVANYQQHPSKVTTWRDGEFVVSQEAERADRTVWVAFDTDGDDASWEGLLATPGDDEKVTVQSVPYFVYDLALGDEVSTVASAEGPLVAVERTRRSGMLTFRVVVDGGDDRWQQLMRDLEPVSCWFDVRSPRFIAIGAPSEHAQAVADYLHGREQRGELQYETGQTK